MRDLSPRWRAGLASFARRHQRGARARTECVRMARRRRRDDRRLRGDPGRVRAAPARDRRRRQGARAAEDRGVRRRLVSRRASRDARERRAPAARSRDLRGDALRRDGPREAALPARRVRAALATRPDVAQARRRDHALPVTRHDRGRVPSDRRGVRRPRRTPRRSACSATGRARKTCSSRSSR